MKAFLVTGTDTGAGKTFVACLLGRRLAAEGVRVRPLKPVETGCPAGPDGKPFPVDAASLRDAIAPTLSLSAICPFPLHAPLSPHLAARGEGVSIAPERIRRTVRDAAEASEILLVEGAGGIAVEICDGYLFSDLARDLSLPVLVVAENRLGVLNHLRLTIRYLRSEGLSLAGVFLNDRTEGPFPARESNEAEVRRMAVDSYLGRVPFRANSLPGDAFTRFRDLCLTA